MRITLEWKPQDCWVGLFWRVTRPHFEATRAIARVDVWICVVPMLPLHVWWWRNEAVWWDEPRDEAAKEKQDDA